MHCRSRFHAAIQPWYRIGFRRTRTALGDPDPQAKRTYRSGTS